MYTSASTPHVVDVTPSPSGDETTNRTSTAKASGGAVHAQGCCSLVIDKQPIEVFYKDEGGKANHLLATVHLSQAAAELVFSSPTSEPPSPVSTLATTATTADGGAPPIAPHAPAVHLTATLYYESGIRVEDGDEIFTILSFERSALKNGTIKAELRFRVEKVSRRKDGQRFKVRFDVDKTKSPSLASGIQGTFTSCVCVLSKRKFSSASNNSADGNGKKGRRGSISIGHSAGGFSYVGGGGGNSAGGRSRKGSMSSVCSAGPATSPSGNSHGSGTNTAGGGGGGGMIMNQSASAAEVQRLTTRLNRFERVNDSLSQTVRAQDERITVLERVLQSTLETQTKLAHQLRQQQQQQQQQQPLVQMQRFSNQQNQLQNLQQHSMQSACTVSHSNTHVVQRSSSSSSQQLGGYHLFNNSNNTNNTGRRRDVHNNNDNRDSGGFVLFDDLKHNSAVSVKAEHLPSSSLSSSPAPLLDDEDNNDEHHPINCHNSQESEDMLVHSLPRPYGGHMLTIPMMPKRQRSLDLLFNFGQPCSSPPLDFGDVVSGSGGDDNDDVDDVDGGLHQEHQRDNDNGNGNGNGTLE